MTCATAGASVKRANATPLTIFGSKLVSWIRADQTSDVSGRIQTWTDLAGVGHVWTQSSSSLRGQKSTALGYATCLFTATAGEYYDHTGTSFTGLTAGHVIRLLKLTNDPAAASTRSGLDEFGSFTGAGSRIPFTDGNCYDATALSGTRVNTGNPSTSLSSALAMYESIATGSKFETRVNGTAFYTGASVARGWTTTPLIGASFVPSGAYMDGHLAEHIVLNAEASAGERTAFAAYVLARYSLTVV